MSAKKTWTPPENPTIDDNLRWIEKDVNDEYGTATASYRLQLRADAWPVIKKRAKQAAKNIEALTKSTEERYGTKKQKEERSSEYRMFLEECRHECPNASSRKIHEIAEAKSLTRFGKKISYKTFERAEKKTK